MTRSTPVRLYQLRSNNTSPVGLGGSSSALSCDDRTYAATSSRRHVEPPGRPLLANPDAGLAGGELDLPARLPARYDRRMAASTPVYPEVGSRRTFAGALDWPGWCRSGRKEELALEALAA
jgi:hypothetical protein